MNRWIITSSLAGALALPLLIAPATASASCSDRKLTGTVVGGVGGALIGNSISGGGGGAVLGGLGGAVLGHEVARSTCGRERYGYRYRHAEYRGGYRTSRHGYRTYGSDPYQADTYPNDAQYAQAPVQHTVYYDYRGNVIYPEGAPGAASYGTAPYASASYAPYAPAYPSTSACRTDTQSYYNDRGELVQRQVQTCAR
ncbi:MAG: hypothetical protein JWO83_2495 [Caulobacteraceae bacterium]|nr:hypothetical protein [Caulobacteraceae bacterium]